MSWLLLMGFALAGKPMPELAEVGGSVGLATRTSLAVLGSASNLQSGHLPDGFVSWLVVPHCGGAVVLAASGDGRQPALYRLEDEGVAAWGPPLSNDHVGQVVLGSDGATLVMVDEPGHRVVELDCDGQVVDERDIWFGRPGCVKWSSGWGGCGRRGKRLLDLLPSVGTMKGTEMAWTRLHTRGAVYSRVHRGIGADGAVVGERTLLVGVRAYRAFPSERVDLAWGGPFFPSARTDAWDPSPPRALVFFKGRVPNGGSWHALVRGVDFGPSRLDRFEHALAECPHTSWSVDLGSRLPDSIFVSLAGVVSSVDGAPMALRFYEDGVVAHGWPLRTRHLIPYDREAPVITETTAAPRRLEEPVCEEP